MDQRRGRMARQHVGRTWGKNKRRMVGGQERPGEVGTRNTTGTRRLGPADILEVTRLEGGHRHGRRKQCLVAE
eukprot:509161-Heterocapsa_arctica.AAC.1